MATATLNPFLRDREASAAARLDALRLRTVLVCVGAIVCVALGVSISIAPLARLVAWLYAAALGQGQLPPAHVPWMGPDEFEGASPVGALVLLLSAAWIGLSLGSFGTLKARFVLLPALALCVVIALFAPPSLGGLRVWPSPLERHIMHGRFDAAETAITSERLSEAGRHYVLAQIALRTAEQPALKRHGTVALHHAQRYVYDAGSAEAATFQPRILHAIDVALHTQPQTEVGLRVASEGAVNRGVGRVTDALRGLMGAALLLAALGLAWAWNGMRRRVANIQVGLTAAPHTTAASGAAGGAQGASPPAATPSIGRRIADALWSLNRKQVAGLMLMGIALVGVVAVRNFTQPDTGARRIRPLDGAYPCELIGLWTSVRHGSPHWVLMHPDGRYGTSPFSQGEPKDQSKDGTWVVKDGDRIVWNHASAPGVQDVNPILEYGAERFTLIEMNGERTRFKRVRSDNRPSHCR